VKLFPAISAALFAALLCSAIHADESQTGLRKSAARAHAHDHDHADHGQSAEWSEADGQAHAESTDGESSTQWPLTLLGLYCVAITGASLIGGWIPQWIDLTHTRMQVIISVIGGLMLGIGVFHLLPHALVELGDEGADLAAYGMMAGMVVMFLLLRMFHFHQHEPANVKCEHDPGSAAHEHSHPTVHDHDNRHKHPHVSLRGAHSLSWVGVFLGMALHTLIDGLALGASVEADALHGITGLLGLGTFLAVLLHKPLDSVSITSLMASGGWSPKSRNLVSAAFALICPLGAGLFVLGVHQFSGQQATVVGCALAVSSGVFICIALSDLLPEMEFHSHNRVRLTIALLAGVALAWGIRFLEPAHAHSHLGRAEHKQAIPQR
jgi:zinc and cadmium transporter